MQTTAMESMRVPRVSRSVSMLTAPAMSVATSTGHQTHGIRSS
jgi:hypothetical protein